LRQEPGKRVIGASKIARDITERKRAEIAVREQGRLLRQVAEAAMSMALMLRLMGDEVRTAHNGLEAVEVAEAFRPQVILMDVGMPRLNGYEATRRIREQPWGQSITIIALTGWGQGGDKLQSKEAGCDGHLVKPVSLPDLQNLLAETPSSR
jgi:CheY-like chemotaxis protein